MATSNAGFNELEIFESVRDLGPHDLLEFLERLAALLPEETRYRLRRTLQSLPQHEDNLQRVFEVVRRQWEGLQSEDYVRIALVGPARTGKASLLEALGGAEDSSSIFSIFDTQVLDEFLGYGRKKQVPAELLEADVIVLVLDAQYSFTEDTFQMVERLRSLDRAFLVALNKIDSVLKPRQVVLRAKRQLKLPVIPVSAFRPSTLPRLLKAISSAFPKAVYPLAHRLPAFRRKLCSGIVSQGAFAAGLTGAVPIPVSDILPISAIQVGMILKLARVFGFRIARGRAKELVPVLLAGILVREGTHRLRVTFPQHRRLISIGAGTLWTYLVGQAAIEYFERLSADSEEFLVSDRDL